MAPLWAIYADSYARNDYRSLVATFKKSWLTSLLYSGASSFGMAILGRYIIAEWTGIKLPAEFQSLLNIFAVYVFFYLIVTPLGVFLNGLGKTKSQAIGGPLMLIAFLLLSPTATRHFGVNGTVAALLISCGFFGWIWFAFDVHAIIKGLKVERNSSKA
jgi:O-antigen/teichoic acid export membrane protein